MKKSLTVWLLICLMVSTALPAKARSPKEKANAALRFSKRDITLLGFTIGESAKSDVLKRMGPAEVFRASHGEGSDLVVCYRSQSSDTVVAFYFGALGGWQDLTKVSVSRSAAFPAIEKCRLTKTVPGDLEFLRGLHLGASRSAVMLALGSPNKVNTKELLSYYVSRPCVQDNQNQKGNQTSVPDCELVDSVTARFRDDKLESISYYEFVDR